MYHNTEDSTKHLAFLLRNNACGLCARNVIWRITSNTKCDVLDLNAPHTFLVFAEDRKVRNTNRRSCEGSRSVKQQNKNRTSLSHWQTMRKRTKYFIHFMELRPVSKANRRSAIQKTVQHIFNPNVHYRVYRSQYT